MAIVRQVSAKDDGDGNFSPHANDNQSASVTINTLACDGLLLGVSYYNTASAPTITDNVDTDESGWSQVLSVTNGAINHRLYKSPMPDGGSSTHTIGVDHGGGTQYHTLIVVGYSGIDLSGAAEDTDQATATSSTTIQCTTGIALPAQDGNLIVAVHGHGLSGGNVSSIGSPFTIVQNGAYLGGDAVAASFSEDIQTTAAARNPLITISQTNNVVMGLASFPAAAAAGSGLLLPSRLRQDRRALLAR